MPKGQSVNRAKVQEQSCLLGGKKNEEPKQAPGKQPSESEANPPTEKTENAAADATDDPSFDRRRAPDLFSSHRSTRRHMCRCDHAHMHVLCATENDKPKSKK